MTIELRRHRRLDFDRRAWCEDQDLTLYLNVANLSRGGMFIQTGSPFPVGQALKVSFCSEEGEEVVLEVEVVWFGRAPHGGPGVGCRLVSFARGRDVFTRLVERLEGGV